MESLRQSWSYAKFSQNKPDLVDSKCWVIYWSPNICLSFSSLPACRMYFLALTSARKRRQSILSRRVATSLAAVPPLAYWESTPKMRLGGMFSLRLKMPSLGACVMTTLPSATTQAHSTFSSSLQMTVSAGTCSSRQFLAIKLSTRGGSLDRFQQVEITGFILSREERKRGWRVCLQSFELAINKTVDGQVGQRVSSWASSQASLIEKPPSSTLRISCFSYLTEPSQVALLLLPMTLTTSRACPLSTNRHSQTTSVSESQASRVPFLMISFRRAGLSFSLCLKNELEESSFSMIRLWQNLRVGCAAIWLRLSGGLVVMMGASLMLDYLRLQWQAIIKSTMKREGCQIILNNCFQTKINQVTKGGILGSLFIGGVDALNPKLLALHKIKAIVAVLTTGELKHLAEDHRSVNALLHLDVYDVCQEQIQKHFQQASRFIEKQLRSGNVLVHCFAGRSRSATIVAAYLMEAKKMKAEQAIRHIAQKRPSIKPNPGFIEQLQHFQKYLKKKKNVRY